MADAARVPHIQDALFFIRDCVRRRRVLWTYHASMRLTQRSVRRTDVLGSVESYEIIEEYPHDKYHPSYLVLAQHDWGPLHVLFAIDAEGDNVRVVTAYRPNPDEWESNFKTRRSTP